MIEKNRWKQWFGGGLVCLTTILAVAIAAGVAAAVAGAIGFTTATEVCIGAGMCAVLLGEKRRGEGEYS